MLKVCLGLQVLVADRRQTTTYDTRQLSVRTGSQDANTSVLVVNVENFAILGIDFLSDMDANIDLVQTQTCYQ